MSPPRRTTAQPRRQLRPGPGLFLLTGLLTGLLAASLVLGCREAKPAKTAPPQQPPAATAGGAATGAPSASRADERIKLEITTRSGNRVVVAAEVAATQEARARGLMFRRSLGRYEAMLFPMGSDSDWSFYMKNTLIPLDMIFLDAAGTVVGLVEDARPLDETPRSAGVLSRFVLEVNGHFCREHGIATGATLDLPEQYRTQ